MSPHKKQTKNNHLLGKKSNTLPYQGDKRTSNSFPVHNRQTIHNQTVRHQAATLRTRTLEAGEVSEELTALLGHLDHQEDKEQTGPEDPPGHKDHKDPKARQVPRVNQEDQQMTPLEEDLSSRKRSRLQTSLNLTAPLSHS